MFAWHVSHNNKNEEVRADRKRDGYMILVFFVVVAVVEVESAVSTPKRVVCILRVSSIFFQLPSCGDGSPTQKTGLYPAMAYTMLHCKNAPPIIHSCMRKHAHVYMSQSRTQTYTYRF